MAKNVYSYISAACKVDVNSPSVYNYYTGKITVDDDTRLLLAFDLSGAKERKVNSAQLQILARSTDDIYLELYSGESVVMSYNDLVNNCKKHAWTGSKKTISYSVKSGEWSTIPLSSYSTGISNAINSGSYLIVAIYSDTNTILEISDTHGASFDLYCERLTPTITNLHPNGGRKYLNKDLTFYWDFNGDGANQKLFEFGWSSDAGVNWNTINKTTSSEYLTFPKYTFPEGNIQWRVKATSNEEKTTDYVYGSFESARQIPSVSINSPNGISIPNDRSYRFEWMYSGEDLKQKSYEIGWSSDFGKTWNIINVESSVNYHLFNAGEFPEGTIQWRVKVSNTENYTSEYSYAEFSCVVNLPTVQIEFPNELKIPNSAEQIFTWIYSGNELEQTFYEIDWSSDGGISWNNVIGAGNKLHHVFAANTFPVGNIIWKIRVKNSQEYFSEYAYGAFECVGRVGAPIIESISQNAIPKITWSAEHQVAFEVQIKKMDTIIFSSGFIGGENKEYQPNIMLGNGNYIIQVRVLNMYGYISEWGTTAFALEAEIPTSTAGIKMSKVDAFGVSFECWDITGTGYIVRVEGDKETIVAKYEGKEIVDYHTRNEQTYTYILREHISGYRDVRKVTFEPDFIGVILHDISNYKDFVNIKWNESDYVEENDILTKNTVYHNCSGRIYPVKETDEQKTEVVTVTGFLNHEDRDKLREYYEKDKIVFLRSKNYCFAADISSFKDNRYHDKGYLVQISLTRIADEQEVSIL